MITRPELSGLAIFFDLGYYSSTSSHPGMEVHTSIYKTFFFVAVPVAAWSKSGNGQRRKEYVALPRGFSK